MRGTHEDLTSFTSQLNWRGTTRFAELIGQTSGLSGIDFDQRMFNYTSLDPSDKVIGCFALRAIYNTDIGQVDVLEFTRRDISRGFALPAIQEYDLWCHRSGLQELFLSSYV